MKDNKKVIAIILGAGMGSRMELGYNKIFFAFKKPLICYTIEAFENTECVDEIIIVRAKNEGREFEEIIKKNKYKKVFKIIEGGKTRQDSSRLGVESAREAMIVVIHDGARPFITSKIILNSVELARKNESNIVAVAVKDTIKQVDKNKIIRKTVDRSELWAAQTPQTFEYDLILKAHQDAYKNNYIGTDEASLVERAGEKVQIIEGSYNNIKITTQEDLLLAELIIKKYKL